MTTYNKFLSIQPKSPDTSAILYDATLAKLADLLNRLVGIKAGLEIAIGKPDVPDSGLQESNNRLQHPLEEMGEVIGKVQALQRELQTLNDVSASLNRQLHEKSGEQELLKEELFKSEERFRAITELSPIGIALAEISTRKFLFINSAALAVFGYSTEEAARLTTADIYCEKNDREELLNELSKNRKVCDYALRLKRKDGTFFWASLYIQQISYNGRPSFFASFLDISEHIKNVEALMVSEKKYRSLFENIGEMVGVFEIVRNEDGLIVDRIICDGNMAFVRWIGVDSIEELRGKSATSLPGNIWAEAAFPIVQKAMDSRSSQNMESQRGNPVRHFISTFVPLDETHYLVTTRDITFIKESEDKVRESENAYRQQTVELTAANHNLEAFAYSITHDLRNPLHSIMACCEVVKEATPAEDKDSHKALDHITNSVERMSQVISDLMSLSKITQHEISLKKCDLSEMAQSIFQELQILDAQRRVETAVEPGLMADADEGLVWILMQNLLHNAWKFTSKNPEARIEFGTTVRDATAVFFVRDNGAGFDMSGAELLFKPFHRLHSRQEYSGTGIGLTIVKRIIEKHGGTIAAEAEKNKGATFYFRLGP